MKQSFKFIVLSVLLSSLTNCSSDTSKPNPPVAPAATAQHGDFLPAEVALTKVQNGALLVDVRSKEEFNTGALKGALNIPHTDVQSRISEVGKDKNREIVVYCKSGRRAGIARETLIANGFKNVFNAGGYTDLATTFAK